MTTTQQIQQEIMSLPADILQEVLDFALFLQQKKAQNQDEVFNAASEKLLRQSQAEIEAGDAYSFDNPDDAIAFAKNIAHVSL